MDRPPTEIETSVFAGAQELAHENRNGDQKRRNFLGRREIGHRDYNVFDYHCQWCDRRALVIAPLREGKENRACPECGHPYNHWSPELGQRGMPGLYAIIDAS